MTDHLKFDSISKEIYRILVNSSYYKLIEWLKMQKNEELTFSKEKLKLIKVLLCELDQ